MVIAHFLPLVVGLLMLAGTHASDVADRSMHQGFLSQYMGSDASKPSLDDYNKFVTPWFNHMKHGGAPDAPSYHNGAAGHDPATMFDEAAHPTTPAQDYMATSVRREPLIAKDSNPSKIVDKEEVRAAQKVFANDNSVPIGMYAIGVSCLTLAAMLWVHMRGGLQQATAFASSGGHESDISIALVPAAAGNILELKTQESIVRGQMGWSQQSSKNSFPLTFCYAGPSGAADFTGFFDPAGLFDLAGLFESVSSSVLKRDKPARVEFGDFSALNEADARRLQQKADKLQDERLALELQEIRLRNKAMELQGGREAELTHDSVAMLASLGFLVGESSATASTQPARVEFGEFSALNKADARRLQEKADKLQDERLALELQEITLRNKAMELQGGREAELTHGSVAMLASLGFRVGESGAMASTKPARVEFGEFSALNKADARRLQEKADKLQDQRIALELQEITWESQIRQDDRIALELQEIRLRNKATELQGGR